MPPVQLDRLGHDLNALAPDRSFLLSLRFVQEHEFQRVEIGSEDQQMVDIALAQNADQIVADLGGQKFGLGKHDAEELFRILGEQFDSLDGVCRVARQADCLWC